MSIVIVDYHKGNLLSVERGLVGAGADVVVTDKADVIRAADAVVLPGVGAFADAAASMEEMDQMEAVRVAVAGGAPFLGICLGMHLMFEAGTEHAPVDGPLPRGLGFIEGVVDAMPRTEFHRPNPLDSDVIMDATARLLAAKPVYHYYKPSSNAASHKKKGKGGEKKAKAAPVEKAPQAAQAAQRRKGPKKGAPAPAQKASGSLHRPPRPGRGRGRIPPRVEPPKSRQKDSTEQQSLMKPFYIEHD